MNGRGEVIICMSEGKLSYEWQRGGNYMYVRGEVII